MVSNHGNNKIFSLIQLVEYQTVNSLKESKKHGKTCLQQSFLISISKDYSLIRTYTKLKKSQFLFNKLHLKFKCK